MPSSRLAALSAAVIAAVGVAASGSAHTNECYSWDTEKLHCFNGQWDTPQKVDPLDIVYVADYLREYGSEVEGGRYWTMTAKDAPGCAEWEVFRYETALVLAKHVGTKEDSKVLYTDIADTIDGGSKDAKSIFGDCQSKGQSLNDGGSFGVQFNASNPAYHTGDYAKGPFTPEGIVIKVVFNPDAASKDL